MLNPLHTFDFTKLSDKSFKEDSVRELLIVPILNFIKGQLGDNFEITRSSNVAHPFVTVGAGKERKITSIPDYVLQLNGKNYCVLDAKAPKENIADGQHQEQAYFYAIHPNIRADFYGLCNGYEIIIWHISEKVPRIHFQLKDTHEEKWQSLYSLFQIDNAATNQHQLPNFNYLDRPLPPSIEPRKQAVRRHFGIHGYFTRQVFNVVSNNIKHFTQVGDVVLDSFGGSGVTVIEAIVAGRIGLHFDINPLSSSWVHTMIAPVDIDKLVEAKDRVLATFKKLRPKHKKAIKEALTQYLQPQNIPILSKGSDVDSLYELFTDKQRAELSCLKHCIQTDKANKTVKSHLMLAFSSSVTKHNLTYHPSSSRGENAGNCSAFQYYRYRLAPKPVELDLYKTYEKKLISVVRGKQEILNATSDRPELLQQSQALKGNASHLPIKDETADYIYTDPPYGSKIHYLDLSVMWNAWLGLPITEKDYENEAIEGGSHQKSRDSYDALLIDSMREMFRVLKWNRWLSFVFQHQDPHYWHIIVDEAEKIGFEYVGTVRQSNGQTSFKKRQNPFTVLSGQLVIYFKKVQNPKARMKYALGNIHDQIFNRIESTIAQNDGATLDEIYADLMIDGMEMGYGDLIAKEYDDITPLLGDNFEYEKETEKYQIRPKGNFRSKIPIEQRVSYFLKSYLARNNRQGIHPTFDNIVYDIMPQLKNGVTPEPQTIRIILEKVAAVQDNGGWRLKYLIDKQQSLF